MVFARTATVSAVSLSFSICLVRAQSGLSPERLQVIQQTMTNVQQEAIGKLPPPVQLTLSGGALNFLHLATAWPKIQQSLGRGDNAAKLAELQAALQAQGSAKPVSSSGPISVSNPASDFVLSIMGGFTQSETSTAWCSSNVVVGFNGQGSFFESLLFGPGGISITGAGASTDGGRSFQGYRLHQSRPECLYHLHS